MISLRGLYETQGMLFLLLILGAFLKRKNIITDAGKSCISDLVIYVTLPCSIVKSFEVEFNMEILKNSSSIIIVSFVTVFASYLMSLFLFNRVSGKQKKVLQYGTLSSNSGILGNPIAEGIFGSMGLFYASIYLIPLRAAMWSLGMTYFTECPDKKTLVKKVCSHPCIIAVAFGCLMMLTQLQLPGVIEATVTSLSRANTGVSMIFIGSIIGSAHVENIFTPTMFYYSLIRLGIIPGLVLLGCALFHVDPLVTGVSVVLSGMPCASVTAILASKYDGDEVFATNCVVFTTILSMVTVPLWCAVLI